MQYRELFEALAERWRQEDLRTGPGSLIVEQQLLAAYNYLRGKLGLPKGLRRVNVPMTIDVKEEDQRLLAQQAPEQTVRWVRDKLVKIGITLPVLTQHQLPATS